MRLTLRELRSLVAEKVRSRSGAFTPGTPNSFNLKQLDRLEGPQMLVYAKHFLEEIGRGSSRAAFLMTSHSVLKLALNFKGNAQNEAEVDVYTNPKTKAIIAKIFDYHPRYRWVVSELVRPLGEAGDDEFKRLTGVEFWPFIGWVEEISKGKAFDVEREMEDKKIPDSVQDFVFAVGNTIRSNDLKMGDIQNVDHWGKTSDSRVVLLDYGFTGEVWDKYYSQPGDDSADPTPDAVTRKA